MTFRRSLGLGLRGRVRCGELRVRWGVGKKLRTRMLTLIFVFKRDFLRFWRDLGPILGGFGRLKWTKKSSFFENVDFAKIIVFPKENCYF